MSDCERCTTANNGPTWCGPCIFVNAIVRPSSCAEDTTEDDRAVIREGMRLFNYYDGQWGYVMNDPDETGWFTFRNDAGHRTTLNGARVSSVDPYPPRRVS